MNKRCLAVDPGEKRLGLAISDLSGTIANPLMVIKHSSRIIDASQIAQIAAEHDVSIIIVGTALGFEGEMSPSARHAQRLADAIQLQTQIPVELCDESFSTQEARQARLAMGVSRRKRSGHLDELAAAVILQTYLDAKNKERLERPCK